MMLPVAGLFCGGLTPERMLAGFGAGVQGSGAGDRGSGFRVQGLGFDLICFCLGGQAQSLGGRKRHKDKTKKAGVPSTAGPAGR